MTATDDQKRDELLADGWKTRNGWWWIRGSQGWSYTLDEAYDYLCNQREIDALEEAYHALTGE